MINDHFRNCRISSLCIQHAVQVVFHSNVNGIFWSGRPNRLKCIFKPGNCWWRTWYSCAFKSGEWGTIHHWQWSHGSLTWWNSILEMVKKDRYS